MIHTTCTVVNCRCVYSGAVWYHSHLKHAVPVVVLTEDQQVLQSLFDVFISFSLQSWVELQVMAMEITIYL